MKTLVLVEHDGGADQGRHAGGRHRRVEARRSPFCSSPARASTAVPRRRRRSPASARSMSPTRAHLEHQLAENVAPVAAGLMANHDAFLAPATTTGKNIAPRVAALLDVMQISEILSVEGEDTFTRPIYAGNAIATVRIERRQEGHHRPRHRFREGGARGRQRRRSRTVDAGGDAGLSAASSASKRRRASGPS